jgi:hypothetical protein
MNTPTHPETLPAPNVTAPPVPIPSPVPIPQSTSPALDKTLGVVGVLSEAERAELQGCEGVIVTGWHTFVDVGLALARIRDGRLYRDDFGSFEAYCRFKWEYGRRYVEQLISAAQVFTYLRASSSHQKPEHSTPAFGRAHARGGAGGVGNARLNWPAAGKSRRA